MSSKDKKFLVGMKGVSVCDTHIASVGKGGHQLVYRGWSIDEITSCCEAEEVHYMLVNGTWPNKKELHEFKRKIENSRALHPAVKLCLERMPGDCNPMAVMRTGVSVLGTLHPETAEFSVKEIQPVLLGSYASMLAYHYYFHKKNIRIDTRGNPGDSISRHFLRLLLQREPEEVKVEAMRETFILGAEHGLCASTWNCRVATSTKTDTWSAIVSAIGTLRGKLHGGASSATMEMLNNYETKEEAIEGTKKLLRRKKKVMGFGHRVYTKCDPRSYFFRKWFERLCEMNGAEGKKMVTKANAIVETMWDVKKLFPNADYYSAPVYHMCGVPESFCTPVITIARTSGWLANIIEQRETGALIRPMAKYSGPPVKEFVPIQSRM